MKDQLLRLFDRLARRAARQGSRLRTGAAFNIVEVARLRAALDSADYYEAHLSQAKTVGTQLELLSLAASLAPGNGLVLEFGVASGWTLNHLAAALPNRLVHGFDTFEGLPQTWRTGIEAGAFAQAPPAVRPNVRLVTGLFADTLPAFVAAQPGPLALLHVDCDLYASTRDVFEHLGERIGAGTVIVFDEYWNYPGWRRHEHRAFQELVDRRSLRYRYEAFVPAGEQVCVLVEG